MASPQTVGQASGLPVRGVSDPARPNVKLEVQETFIATGNETLDKLDDYLQSCDAVIHLVGDMTGACAQASALASLRARYSDLADRLEPIRQFLEPDADTLPYTLC